MNVFFVFIKLTESAGAGTRERAIIGMSMSRYLDRQILVTIRPMPTSGPEKGKGFFRSFFRHVVSYFKDTLSQA